MLAVAAVAFFALSIFWWMQVAREGRSAAWVAAIGFTIGTIGEVAALVQDALRRRPSITPPPTAGR
jgi:hypothetical protein